MTMKTTTDHGQPHPPAGHRGHAQVPAPVPRATGAHDQPADFAAHGGGRPRRWRFEFYGTDRLTCRGAQIPIIALGPYPEAAADAWDRARDLMLSPELITSNLLHW